MTSFFSLQPLPTILRIQPTPSLARIKHIKGKSYALVLLILLTPHIAKVCLCWAALKSILLLQSTVSLGYSLALHICYYHVLSFVSIIKMFSKVFIHIYEWSSIKVDGGCLYVYMCIYKHIYMLMLYFSSFSFPPEFLTESHTCVCSFIHFFIHSSWAAV